MMNMRGMIKWQPFSTMLTKKDINNIEKSRQKIQKPILGEDKIIEINEILLKTEENHNCIKITYFKLGTLYNIIGTIKKINTIEKYILINSTRIYFKNIINITEL